MIIFAHFFPDNTIILDQLPVFLVNFLISFAPMAHSTFSGELEPCRANFSNSILVEDK